MSYVISVKKLFLLACFQQEQQTTNTKTVFVDFSYLLKKLISYEQEYIMGRAMDS